MFFRPFNGQPLQKFDKSLEISIEMNSRCMFQINLDICSRYALDMFKMYFKYNNNKN